MLGILSKNTSDFHLYTQVKNSIESAPYHTGAGTLEKYFRFSLVDFAPVLHLVAYKILLSENHLLPYGKFGVGFAPTLTGAEAIPKVGKPNLANPNTHISKVVISNTVHSNTPFSNLVISSTPFSNLANPNTPFSNLVISNTPFSNLVISNKPISNTPFSNKPISNTAISNM